MDINIRRAVIANLKGSSAEDIKKTIVDAISLGEEKVLPGLGVLFELVWQKGSSEDQSAILNLLTQSLV
ncbi:MAG TPA: small acid-soluble spore protein SspI [Bacilli bacterium]|nr:small acid-soluble spore protein SspI [Acholeplasmataceae bacterium]OQB63600.1 MAG: Small, acid-soluble spore protein I [Tenericutes bacterium ADurb.Bin140]HOE77335.1 small acid-soluble spore protein SspI [Bacilli bacterium]HON63645.1 small acid-soluble spore protein SspI [Bacilli bacterium]HOR96076.1 small acid-soluble spore protein SspI [Bacilli bacterium]